jgi:hypothetical protein
MLAACRKLHAAGFLTADNADIIFALALASVFSFAARNAPGQNLGRIFVRHLNPQLKMGAIEN